MGDLRLYVHRPTVVFQARVNQAGFTYPLAEVTYDGVSIGAFGDIKVGQTVTFGSAADLDDYGIQRIRKAADATKVYIGRSSQGTHLGEVTPVDNAWITVWNTYGVWAKIPFIDTSVVPPIIYKDHDLVVGTNTTTPPPVANTGPGYAATINSGTSLITAQFVGTNSFANAGTISTYLWDVADGTITVGTSASSTITATFPAGMRWVSLTVTDSAGKTHKAVCPVYARDPANDTTVDTFQIESHRITQAGQQMSVRVLSSLPPDDYPDGTFVMVMDGEPASSSDRTNLLFVGWHHTDPATIEATRTGTLKSTTLNCLDVAGRLDVLHALTQTVADDTTRDTTVNPSITWNYMEAPNKDKYLHYLLHWHSNALDVADWSNTGTGSTYPFVVRSNDGSSLWDQVAREAKTIVPNYILTCNTLGQLFTKVDPMLQDTASRTATVQTTLDGTLWSDIRFTHQRHPRYHWLRENAILASTTDIAAIFAIAPGEAPAQGELAQDQGEQLAVEQNALNSQAGHRYARINAPESMFNITLAQGDDLDIEPANMTWVRLTITAALAAQRGLAFTNARGLVHEINIRYSHERTGIVRIVDLTWERETTGSAAITETPPGGSLDTALPEPDPGVTPPPDGYNPTPGPTTPTGGGQGTVYVMDDNDLKRTLDFSAASPVWVAIDPAGAGGAFYDFILDPWAPSTTGYLASVAGIWKSTDLDQTTPTWTNVLTLTQMLAATGFDDLLELSGSKLVASISIQGYVGIIWLLDLARRAYYCFTTDSGATWNFVLIDTMATGVVGHAGAWDMVQWLNNGAHILWWYNDRDTQLWKSTDSGATWGVAPGSNSPASGGSLGTVRTLHVPYEGNTDGQIIFLGSSGTPGANGYRTFHTLSGGVNWYTLNGGLLHCGPKRGGLEAYTQDRSITWGWFFDDETTDLGQLWTTTSGEFSFGLSLQSYWTQKAASGLAGRVQAASGFPYNSGQFYIVTTTRIMLSTDGGATFTNKTGDFGAISIDTMNGFGNVVITPLWTQ